MSTTASKAEFQDGGMPVAQPVYVVDTSGNPTSPVTGASAVTIANGADVAQGSVADAAWSGSGNGTLVALLKAVYAHLGNVSLTNDGTSTTAITAGVATNTVIKATAGRLARILVTATGTNQMNIYDNASGASGTIIGVVPASATVGTVVELRMPASNGMVVAGNSANPGVTIAWS